MRRVPSKVIRGDRPLGVHITTNHANALQAAKLWRSPRKTVKTFKREIRVDNVVIPITVVVERTTDA